MSTASKPGRKPIADKKVGLTIYVAKSIVNDVGADKLRTAMLKAVKREILKS
jgi:hypothetical protein